MKNIIIIFALLIFSKTHSQVVATVQLDPTMLTAESGLDFTISISDTTDALDVGFLIESYKKRNYFSYAVLIGKTISIKHNLEIAPSIEVGEILRSKLPVFQTRTTTKGFYYFGGNIEIRYFIFKKIGVSARTNYKRRTDLTGIYGKNAVKYRLSNYVGFSYIIK